MCYSVAFLEQKAAKYAERYKTLLPPDWSFHNLQGDLPKYYFVSGFSHPALPVIKADGIHFCEWGLIPSWIKDQQAAKDIRRKTLNAVGETVFEKPSFRKPIISQRCLLGIHGFYEWHEFRKAKYPFFIALKEKNIFSLACIYDHWVDKSTGEIRNTFSILTTPANSMMEKIHNTRKRMPLILKQQDEEKWIDPFLGKDMIKKLIKPLHEIEMTAYPVSTKLNDVRADRNIPEIMEKVLHRELDDLTSTLN